VRWVGPYPCLRRLIGARLLCACPQESREKPLTRLPPAITKPNPNPFPPHPNNDTTTSRSGIKALWDSGEWQQLIAAPDLKSSPLMTHPPLDASDMQRPGSGAKRGLLDAVLALSVTEEVLQDLEAHLPPVPADQEEERALAFELYSAQRVQLAALPRAVLERVCSCARGCEAGGDMWEVLAPLRALRPVNGGPGWDEDAVMGLRALDLYISMDGGGGDDEEMEDAANNAVGAA